MLVKGWHRQAVLSLIVATFLVTWGPSGRTQTACIVDRGQDPLDIVRYQVRHNVYIILDGSGSMGAPFPSSQTGNSKAREAHDVLYEILDEFVDSNGQPLVNWGFTYFLGQNVGGAQDPCQNRRACSGVNDFIDPQSCVDTRGSIKPKIDYVADNIAGRTPLGISLDNMSQRIVSEGGVTNLSPGQKNFILFVTDGFDTCECYAGLDDNNPKPVLRGSSVSPAPNFPIAYVPPRQDVNDCSQDGNTTDPLAEDAAQISAYNAGLKARQAFLRLNAGATDGSKGEVLVMGMGALGTDPCILDSTIQVAINHIAWEGSGGAFGRPQARPALFADDRNELKQKLLAALYSAIQPTAEVSLGPAVVGTVWERVADVTNPNSGVDSAYASPGSELAARNVRTAHRNNVLFTTTAEVPSFKGHLRATSVYKVLSNGTRVQNLGQQLWDAGTLLRDRHPDQRTIFYTQRNSTTLRPFVAGPQGPNANDLGVGPGFLSEIDGQGARSANDARDIVVNVTRGYRLSIDSTSGTFYRKSDGQLNFSDKDPTGANTWKLYEPANAGVVVVLSPNRAPDLDPPLLHRSQYQTFYNAFLNRRTVVYLATDGGMLHAFRADNGAELYGLIPDDVLGLGPTEIAGSRKTLKDLVQAVVAGANTVDNHNYLMGGSATAEDVFIRPQPNLGDPTDPGVWRTVITFGRGPAGKFLTALDVTDIGNWDQTPGQILDRLTDQNDPRAPKLLFNVGNRQYINTGLNDGVFDTLGETWSVPVMAPVAAQVAAGGRTFQSDQWVVFAGSGYGCRNTSEGKSFYVLRVEDGQPYRPPFSIATRDAGTSTVQNAFVAMPAVYNPHRYDVGNLYQDFVTKVFIGDLHGRVWKLNCSAVDPNQWVFDIFYDFGTDYPIAAGAALLKDPGADQVLVFVGTGADNRIAPLGSGFKIAGIADNDADGFDGRLLPLASGGNFLLSLAQGERVWATPVSVDTSDGQGAVFFGATRAYFDGASCGTRYQSSLYGFAARNGLAAYDLDPAQSGTQSQVSLGDGKVQGLYVRDAHLYVGRSGSLGTVADTLVRGDQRFPTPSGTGGGSSQQRMVVSMFRQSRF